MKKILLATLAVAAFAFTACNDENKTVTVVNYDFELSASDYTADGYWTEVYNETYKTIGWTPDLQTTHSASSTEYNGVTYKSWTGICPTESTDKADHTGDDWTKYQWGSITGTGANGSSKYLVCYWDVNETTTEVPSLVSCGLGTFSGGNFEPQTIYVTNSAYGYWAMRNGTAYSHAFTADDWCKLTIIGVDGYTVTGKVEVYLARGTEILDQWQAVDLTPLGECNAVYFQMSSSDTGQWGMNNPAYFCLDDLTVLYQSK